MVGLIIAYRFDQEEISRRRFPMLTLRAKKRAPIIAKISTKIRYACDNNSPVQGLNTQVSELTDCWHIRVATLMCASETDLIQQPSQSNIFP